MKRNFPHLKFLAKKKSPTVSTIHKIESYDQKISILFNRDGEQTTCKEMTLLSNSQPSKCNSRNEKYFMHKKYQLFKQKRVTKSSYDIEYHF